MPLPGVSRDLLEGTFLVLKRCLQVSQGFCHGLTSRGIGTQLSYGIRCLRRGVMESWYVYNWKRLTWDMIYNPSINIDDRPFQTPGITFVISL